MERSHVREGLEEYALTLDLRPEEVLALLDSAMSGEPVDSMNVFGFSPP